MTPPKPTGDPRLADLFQAQADAETRVAIVGFPCDLGVARNGGRVGASEGPEKIRHYLAKLTPDSRGSDSERADHLALLERTVDLGDVGPPVKVDASQGAGAPCALERGQKDLGRVVEEQRAAGRIVIVLGGGHETFYGHFLGYTGASERARVLNWDAHADVRDLVAGRGHSGSPFRQALEHESESVDRYVVAGLQPSSVAASHLDYLGAKRARAIWRDEVDVATVAELYRVEQPTLVSFDLDCVEAAAAPGVSAPTPAGLEAKLIFEAAKKAGECSDVRSIDVVELNPLVDQDDRTARLAALLVWWFLRGLASRPLAPQPLD